MYVSSETTATEKKTYDLKEISELALLLQYLLTKLLFTECFFLTWCAPLFILLYNKNASWSTMKVFQKLLCSVRSSSTGVVPQQQQVPLRRKARTCFLQVCCTDRGMVLSLVAAIVCARVAHFGGNIRDVSIGETSDKTLVPSKKALEIWYCRRGSRHRDHAGMQLVLPYVLQRSKFVVLPMCSPSPVLCYKIVTPCCFFKM